MKLAIDHGGGRYVIRAYARGRVVINDQVYTRSLILTPEQLVADWPPQRLEELTVAHIEPIAALAPDVVLIGTGERLHFLGRTLLEPLARARIGVECMDTAAACRSFTVLAAEGRRVAAALLLD